MSIIKQCIKKNITPETPQNMSSSDAQPTIVFSVHMPQHVWVGRLQQRNFCSSGVPGGMCCLPGTKSD